MNFHQVSVRQEDLPSTFDNFSCYSVDLASTSVNFPCGWDTFR